MANPLGEKDLQAINANLTQLNIADEQIKLAQQAGLDVAGLKEQASAQRGQLLKMKQAYFPGK